MGAAPPRVRSAECDVRGTECKGVICRENPPSTPRPSSQCLAPRNILKLRILRITLPCIPGHGIDKSRALASTKPPPTLGNVAVFLDMASAFAQGLTSNPEGPEVVHLRVSFTKELNGDTGLTYMYQRWFRPETGTFMSSAPYPVMMEHRFGFAVNDPTRMRDVTGQLADYACVDHCKKKFSMPTQWL